MGLRERAERHFILLSKGEGRNKRIILLLHLSRCMYSHLIVMLAEQKRNRVGRKKKRNLLCESKFFYKCKP